MSRFSRRAAPRSELVEPVGGETHGTCPQARASTAAAAERAAVASSSRRRRGGWRRSWWRDSRAAGPRPSAVAWRSAARVRVGAEGRAGDPRRGRRGSGRAGGARGRALAPASAPARRAPRRPRGRDHVTNPDRGAYGV